MLKGVRYPVFTKASTLMNIYLHSDPKHNKSKIALLNKLTNHQFPTKFLYAAGDTNVKLEKEDISSGQITTKEVRTAYKRFINKHGLREIHQPYRPGWTEERGP